MPSPACEKAIDEANACGRALLKFISPNDAGVTGTHQSGFLLPKPAWRLYSPHPPRKGVNTEHEVIVTWQDGRQTHSHIKWYGTRTRSEYRLTRFGRDFPYRTADNVGDLLVLVPRTLKEFSGYVFDLEEDIDTILSTLDIEPFERWSRYDANSTAQRGDARLDALLSRFAHEQTDFPSGETLAEAARRILSECVDFQHLSQDQILLKALDVEYSLFRKIERIVCYKEIDRKFESIDDFVNVAVRLLNRRKSRAGRSLECHVDYLLTTSGIPHEMRPNSVDGRPDIVLPDARSYNDPRFPPERLVIVGVKRTCKDRWRQVLNEGRRVASKHILTTQVGISSNQLREMLTAGITLVVPEELHEVYPSDTGIELLTVRQFIDRLKERFLN